MAAETKLRADGCFVMPPFVWNSFRDINEPTQKAILLYDAGREDMILQVRYEGPVTQFGWLIPVPSRPEIAAASIASFYELSRFTQEYLYRRQQELSPARAGGPSDVLPPVTVVEYRTVGAYDVAILATDSAKSNAAWLLQNDFTLRQGSQTALQSYLDKHWYIVALRVHLDQSGGKIRQGSSPDVSSDPSVTLQVSKALRMGELHPIKISFDTSHCIFPLRISSLNGRPSEVLLYVLSAEPLTCESLVKPPGDYLPTELERYFPAGAVAGDRLPKCSADLPRLVHKKWAFEKFLRVFRPEQMEDLKFKSMFPLIRNYLSGANAYEARSRLCRFDELATPLLPDLAHSPVTENRVACCGMLRLYSRQGSVELLLELLDDPDWFVRSQACAAAGCYNHPLVISKLLVLIGDTKEGMASTAALSCGELGVADPRVIAALIELLDDQYPNPREMAQAALVKITGQKFKDYKQWRDWWAANKARFATKERSP
jgi:hypothetical protein